MKIPRKQLRTILVSICLDESAAQPNTYAVELQINGVGYTEILELEDEGTVIGSIEAFEPRWWAFDIFLVYFMRFTRGESLSFPIDLGDLGDPALARKPGEHG